jgi:hypothetical protein
MRRSDLTTSLDNHQAGATPPKQAHPRRRTPLKATRHPNKRKARDHPGLCRPTRNDPHATQASATTQAYTPLPKLERHLSRRATQTGAPPPTPNSMHNISGPRASTHAGAPHKQSYIQASIPPYSRPPKQVPKGNTQTGAPRVTPDPSVHHQ